MEARHFTSQRMKTKIFLCLIIGFGFILRVAYVDQFPKTLYGDEQAFAWNAYNILKLGEDEYGNPYPLQFRSFGDYKSPLPVYLLVPFIKIFDLTIFAIRLPIVLFSALTVFLTFKLARIFFDKKTSLISAFLLAVSPWHVHLSRGFFESTLSLFFFVGGIYFFLNSKNRLRIIIVSMTFFALSLYSYFTPRILVPIFLVLLVWYMKSVKTRNFWVGLIFFVFISLPLLRFAIFDSGLSRFNKLNVAMDRTITESVNKERFASQLSPGWKIIFHNKATVWVRMVTQNYLEHLSLNYWYIFGDNSLRYFLGNMGMFYLLELPFIIYGLYILWRDKRRVALFFVFWVLLSPIPASLVGKPFALRSMAMLPTPFFFVAYGINGLIRRVNSTRFMMLCVFLLALGYVWSIFTVLIRYYREYPVYAATWWGWENKAALDYAKSNESLYEKIFLSDYYSGITLAYAVYNKVDPLEYRRVINNPIVLADNRHFFRFGKLYFGSLDLDGERIESKIIPPNSLYIGRPEEPEGSDRITAPDDGRLLYVIHDTIQE